MFSYVTPCQSLATELAKSLRPAVIHPTDDTDHSCALMPMYEAEVSTITWSLAPPSFFRCPLNLTAVLEDALMTKVNRPDPVFDLRTIFQEDVRRLLVAHQIGKVFHQGKNISAAGDEVEVQARRLFRHRLPKSYTVGEGHIVDSELHMSGQCDIVIADKISSQVLAKAKSRTEYFPYESVYAVGEVKSSYKKEHIAQFVEKVTQLRCNLERKATDRPSGTMYGNPLFSFLLFVDGAEFKADDVSELHENTFITLLPTVVCFLNKGNIVHMSFGQQGNFRPNHQPELIEPRKWKTVDSHHYPESSWQFLPHGNEEKCLESNFGLLFFMLMHHLQACVLEATPTHKYLRHIFNFNPPLKVSEAKSNWGSE